MKEKENSSGSEGPVGEEPRWREDNEVLRTLLGIAIRHRLSDPAESHRALHSLSELIWSRYYASFRRQLKSRFDVHTATANDSIQDGMVLLLKDVGEGRMTEIPEDILSYVSACTKHNVLKKVRHRKVTMRHEGNVRAREKAVRSEGAMGLPTRMQLKEASERIESALDAIKGPTREVVELSASGMQDVEIAEHLGMKPDAVRKLRYRAEQRVLTVLADSSPTAAGRLNKMLSEKRAQMARVTVEAFEAEIAKLPDDYQQFARTHWLEGRTLEEAGELVSCEDPAGLRQVIYTLLHDELGAGIDEHMGSNVPEDE